MKPIFISYGRRESLILVGKLHQQLKLAGFEGWFDKVNIPNGDDYAHRIAQGIESADNFAYVMAPRCMVSPYCLVELEYAKILGKRIIPLAQLPIFDTPAKELSETDKQVMKDFYKAHHITGVEITTEKDVLDRSHAVLGRADWIYTREELTNEDIQAINKWQQEYENFWTKHESISYLQDYQFPEFGKSIDKFDTVVTALIELIEKYQYYTKLHTKILIAALEWQAHQKQTEYLLVGKERIEAERWLLQEFIAPEQAPCLPSALMAEFICESKKNAENLMTDVFVSYSSKDKVLQNKIYVALSKKLVTTWHYKQDIGKAEDAEQATWRGLEQADNFVFLISNYSLQSEFCLKELNYAFDLQKRIVPLLVEKLNSENTAKLKTLTKLNNIQFINFTDNTEETHFQSDISDILRELNKEKRYHEQHKVFLVQGLKWEKQQRNASILLRGSNLENAKTWLNTAKTRTDYKPTKIHEEFIGESLAKIGQLGSEVFISYSRNDADFARKMNNELQLYGKTTWFDQESISSGADFQQEIYKGIAESDNFVFLISPKSVNSPYCEDEVNFAATQGKRFITLLVEKLDTESHTKFNSLKALSQVQWIDCTHKDFYSVFMQLIRQIDTDREHVEQHTKWQKKATEAKSPTPNPSPQGGELTPSPSGRVEQGSKTPPVGGWGAFKPELLLRGSELILAQAWLEDAEKNKKNPKPTDIQKALIEASEQARKQAEEAEKQVAKNLKNRLRIAVGAVIMAVFAVIAALIALNNAKVAQAEVVRQLVKDVREEIDNQEYEWCIATLKSAMSLGQEKEQVAAAMLEIAFVFSHSDSLKPRSQRLIDSVKQFYSNEIHTTKYLTEKYFPVFVPIEGGTFTMGSKRDSVLIGQDSISTEENEKPAHEVQLSNFSMATTEVTFAQYSFYASAVKITPRAKIDGNYNGKNPVHSVSWYDACRYANWLSEQQGRKPAYLFYDNEDNTKAILPTNRAYYGDTTGKEFEDTNFFVVLDSTANGYRLPTEAEWEYAAKEGKYQSDFVFSGSNDLNEVGWYYDNRKKGDTQPVATKKPNRLGLYDMSGNIWEWCEDFYDESFYEICKNQGIVKNPINKNRANSAHILRDGSWNYVDNYSRVAYRSNYNPDVRDFNGGFRLCFSQY